MRSATRPSNAVCAGPKSLPSCAWRDAGLAVPQVAVNISARQFGDDRLPALVQAA